MLKPFAASNTANTAIGTNQHRNTTVVALGEARINGSIRNDLSSVNRSVGRRKINGGIGVGSGLTDIGRE
jgi:hypothetical protein